MGPHGRCPSWLRASPVLRWTCLSAGHSGGPHQKHPRSLAQRHFAPARFPPAAFCAVCGAEINPSRLHPPISRPCQGQADDAPAAPFGPIPAAAQVWLWGSPCSWVAGTSPLCWLCQPGISHAAVLRHHCAMSCVPPLCPCSVFCLPAPCPCSTSHVPTACPVSLHPSMWLPWVPALWAAVWELGPSRLAQGGCGECARGPL